MQVHRQGDPLPVFDLSDLGKGPRRDRSSGASMSVQTNYINKNFGDFTLIFYLFDPEFLYEFKVGCPVRRDAHKSVVYFLSCTEEKENLWVFKKRTRVSCYVFDTFIPFTIFFF